MKQIIHFRIICQDSKSWEHVPTETQLTTMKVKNSNNNNIGWCNNFHFFPINKMVFIVSYSTRTKELWDAFKTGQGKLARFMSQKNFLHLTNALFRTCLILAPTYLLVYLQIDQVIHATAVWNDYDYQQVPICQVRAFPYERHTKIIFFLHIGLPIKRWPKMPPVYAKCQ